MRFLAALRLLLLSFLPFSALGQSANVEPLIVPFVPSPPFMQLEADGKRSGFFVELAEMIGAEIGAPIQFLDSRTSQEALARQAAGQTHMIAGEARRHVLAGTNVYSVPVAIEEVRIAVLNRNAQAWHTDRISDRKIGILPSLVGSDDPILTDNTAVAFDNTQTALIELLAGTVDALLMPSPILYRIARFAGVDGRIAFVENNLGETTRHVALHESRAEFLEPINAAIARLEADGRLEELRQRYEIVMPPPPTEVLSVGVADFGNYSQINDDGTFSGFAVDALRDLADRAGLQLRFLPLTTQEWQEGPGERFDLLPQISSSAERAERMDFTLPIEIGKFAIFLRSGETDGISGLADLKNIKVGVQNVSRAIRDARQAGLDEIVEYDQLAELVSALQRGEIDAALYSVEPFEGMLEANGFAGEIERVEPSYLEIERVIALRRGLGSVREKLNAVIPGYLISGDYHALQIKYFGEPVFWTPTRLYMLYAAIAAAFLGLIGCLFWQRQRQIQRDLQIEREKQAAVAEIKEQLQTVLDTASNGIIALDVEGQVVMANPSARHMLGGVSQLPPFAWPEDIRFLDIEEMKPLEASNDPVNRALVGQVLRAETNLMTRRGSDVNRYVRINSAIAQGAKSDIRAVLALDDVTVEEKNRQQAERSARLDALGQLTGGIAHDFNNLLGMILGSVELAQMKPNDPEFFSQLDVAIKSVNRGSELTKRLLAFARRQPGLAKAQFVEESFANVVALAKPTIEENIHIEVIAEQPHLWAFCDPGQLENALLNLIINARDAIVRSKTGDRILLRVRGVDLADQMEPADPMKADQIPGFAEASHVYRAQGMKDERDQDIGRADGRRFRYIDISVTDNGPGMSDEVKRRAIDPFFTTKGTNSGTGLGLSMVYGFVQQSDGELSIYSELGTGTTVRMLLPRAEPHGEREAPVIQVPAEMGDGRTILAVEDEATLLGVLTASLGAIGYKVRVAANGVEALEILQRGEQVDLLLTDIVMPGGVGGFELAREARKLRPDLPVIYMSGYTGFDKGQMGEVIAPMIEKPCSMLELSRVLKAEFAKAERRS